MKTRWMTAVLENSAHPAPVMPFHRSVRMAARMAPVVRTVKIA
ncbi:MAG: hypothetical protein AAF280_05090 [Pseudomonadota bacterium]